MDPVEPAYRAALCKGALEAIMALPAGARIVAKVDPVDLDRIRGASRVDWLPARSLDSLNRAALDVRGDAGYVELWRGYSTAVARTPLFGPLASAAISIFGGGPGGLLRWVGRAWERTTRGYGQVECVVDDGACRAELRLVGLPECGRTRPVALSMKAGILGVLDLARAHGAVVMQDERLVRAGEVTFRGEWA